jgi:hypothetical protein
LLVPNCSHYAPKTFANSFTYFGFRRRSEKSEEVERRRNRVEREVEKLEFEVEVD